MKRIITKLVFLSIATLTGICCDGPEQTTQKKPILRIDFSEKVVPNKEGFLDISITSNTEWKVEAKSPWLSTKTEEGNGNKQIRIEYQSNTAEKRIGVVRFKPNGLNPIDLVITQTDLTFTNPIFDMADPWVVKHKGYYYTCKASGSGINISRSDKLSVINGTTRVWTAPSDAGGGAIKPWNISNIWAPELHFIDGRWYIYYAAGRPTSESNGSYEKQRTGVLRSATDDPFGKWEDMGMIYTGNNYTPGIVANVNNTIYAIDMGVFYLKGQLYAIWSGNKSETEGEQRLYIASMSNPYTISSSRVEISRAEQGWEKYSGTLNEGPAFLYNKDKSKFFVVYSCNGSWTKYYSLGYLMLDANANPMIKSNWTKSSSNVFYRCDDTASTNGVNGVGHCSFTTSPDDTEDWIVYHAKNRNDNTWASGRSTFIKKFTWKADGTPDFGSPVSWGEEVALPSGENQ